MALSCLYSLDPYIVRPNTSGPTSSSSHPHASSGNLVASPKERERLEPVLRTLHAWLTTPVFVTRTALGFRIQCLDLLHQLATQLLQAKTSSLSSSSSSREREKNMSQHRSKDDATLDRVIGYLLGCFVALDVCDYMDALLVLSEL